MVVMVSLSWIRKATCLGYIKTHVEDGVLELPNIVGGDKFGVRTVGSSDAELLVVAAPNKDYGGRVDCGVAYIYKYMIYRWGIPHL